MRTMPVIAAATVLSGVCVLLKLFDSHSRHDLIGTAVACTDDFPFQDVHAEILEYGLQDARGLACDDTGRVFVSEGRRAVVVYSMQSEVITQRDNSICPQAPCRVTDRRGLAFLKPALYVAEHGRAQIMVRNFGPSGEPNKSGSLDTSAGTNATLTGATELLSAPSGVASAEETLFITNDPAEPAAKEHLGTVYACEYKNCEPKLVAHDLQHPSGIAAASKDGPIYVAEVKGREVSWPIFRKRGERWVQSGALGSAPFTAPISTAFLGVALSESKSTIFAAGPGGLYVFAVDGSNTGRILFDDPVTGVASCGRDVYFVSGQMLCRLRPK